MTVQAMLDFTIQPERAARPAASEKYGVGFSASEELLSSALRQMLRC